MEKANTQLQTRVLENSNSMQRERKLLRDIMAIRDSSRVCVSLRLYSQDYGNESCKNCCMTTLKIPSYRAVFVAGWNPQANKITRVVSISIIRFFSEVP
jgi:hypothetical protein